MSASRFRGLILSALLLAGAAHGAPDEVVAALADLAPNQAVYLGDAEVVGDFNEVARRFDLDHTGPLRRDYSLKMVWAPERHQAIYLGANHGKPHRLNDVWSFDLRALEWTLLYAPDLPRDYRGLGEDASDVVLHDGVLMTRRGGPAIIGHGWSSVTYDAARRKVLFMNAWPANRNQIATRLKRSADEIDSSLPMWTFDPAQKSWAYLKTGTPQPPPAYGALLEFNPEGGGAIYHGNDWQLRGTWWLDSASDTWVRLLPKKGDRTFSRNAPGRELVGYFDPRRELLICRAGKRTFRFDPKAQAWTAVPDGKGSPATLPGGHDARNVFLFDSATGRGLLVDLSNASIHAFDPDRSEWKALDPDGPPMPDGERMLAYFDHRDQVLVVIDERRVWAYRPGD